MNVFKKHFNSLYKVVTYGALVFGALILLLTIFLSPAMKFAWTGVSKVIVWIGSTLLVLGAGLFLYVLIKTPKQKRKRSTIINYLVFAALFYLSFSFAHLKNEQISKQPTLVILYFVFWAISLLVSLLKSGFDLHYYLTLRKEEEVEENKIVIDKKVAWKHRWKKAWESWDLGSLRYYVVFVGALAIFYLGFALFQNQFTVPLGGDYTQQTIPFYTNGYDDWWAFIKGGEFPLWDSNTFLGVDNIGSNSFYYAMNPFFFPILLFPRKFIAQGIAVLMIVKLILAALTMNKYLQYMGVSKNSARFFGIAYAFMGWNTYYLWFNHFMEVAVLFPLIFLGLEKVLKERRPWTLIFSLALMGLTNYFFLVTASIAGVIYAVFRYFQLYKHYSFKDHLSILSVGFLGAFSIGGAAAALIFMEDKFGAFLIAIVLLIIGIYWIIYFYKNTVNERWINGVNVIFLGIGSFVLGIFLSTIVFIPGVITASGSDRVTGATYLDNLKEAFELKNWQTFFDYLFRWETQNATYDYKVYYPLITFFFPVLSNRSASLLPTSSYDNTISSLFIFTPLMLLLVPALIHSFKKRKPSHFIALGFFIFTIFTPFMYNLFHGFTKEYGRWQIFAVFAMISYIAISYEARSEWKSWYIDISFIVILVGAWLTYLWASNYLVDSTRFSALGQREYYIYFQFFALIAVYAIYKFAFRDRYLTKYLTAFLAVEVIIMGAGTMLGHGLVSYQYNVGGGIKLVEAETKVMNKIAEYDDEYYRIYNSNTYKANSNVGMRENYNGISGFHSLYNFNLKEFNRWSKVNYNYKGWSLGVHEKRFNLDQFLGVKYYVLDKNDNAIKYGNNYEEIGTYNIPYGFSRVFDENGEDLLSSDTHLVYRNENFVELGSSFTTLMSSDREESSPDSSIFYSAQPYEVIRNEEMYLNYGILRQADIDEILEEYPSFGIDYYYYYPRFSVMENTSGGLMKEEYVSSQQLDDATIGKLETFEHVSKETPTTYEFKKAAIVITRQNGLPILSEPGQITLELSFKYNARVFLIDEADEVILFDSHNGKLSDSNFKRMRSYYSDVPVSKIVIMPLSTWSDAPSNYRVFFSSNDQMQQIVDSYKEGQLLNVRHTKNAFYFETAYETPRFVVTHIPYDDGWGVQIRNARGEVSTPKVYLAQGGFVGFVMPSGYHEVVMRFWTPGLSLGIALTSVSLITTLGLYGIHTYLKNRDKLAKTLREELEEARL